LSPTDRPQGEPDESIEPTERRRRLGGELLRLRVATGLNQTGFGARVGMNQSKVSRLETARQVPTVSEAGAWAEASGLTGDESDRLRAWVEDVLSETVSIAEITRYGVAARQRQIAQEERAASTVRTFELSIVPGLLQTAEYTQRHAQLVTELQPAIDADLPASLAAFAARQQVLYEPGRRFEFVVTEAALRWRPGPDDNPRMLAGQLHHIASLMTLDTVRLGVIPWRRAMRACPMHEFIVYGEPGSDDDVRVKISTTTRSLHIRDEAQIAVYLKLWETLRSDAIFGDEAREMITGIATELLAEG
jgi:transcriptional regulator with XRE-family HTH domain